MNKILTVLENMVKPAHPWQFPKNVDIEITNMCQLNCDMCPRQGFRGERETGKMTLRQFQYILSEISPVPYISFSGNGEATLHPQFMEFFRMARKSGKKMTISTNGLGIANFSDRELRELVEGFCSIDISLDSPYRDRYEDIRKGASFDTLLKNIKKLVGISQREKDSISIHLVYIDQKKDELEDIVNLSQELGVKVITVGKLMSYSGSCAKERRSITPVDMRELKNVADKKGIDLSFNFYKNFRLSKKIIGCNWPWRYAFISYEGVVTPCCSLKDPTKIKLGNIFEESFKDIWQGEKFVEFRQNIKFRSFPSICLETRCWFIDK